MTVTNLSMKSLIKTIYGMKKEERGNYFFVLRHLYGEPPKTHYGLDGIIIKDHQEKRAITPGDIAQAALNADMTFAFSTLDARGDYVENIRPLALKAGEFKRAPVDKESCRRVITFVEESQQALGYLATLKSWRVTEIAPCERESDPLFFVPTEFGKEFFQMLEFLNEELV